MGHADGLARSRHHQFGHGFIGQVGLAEVQFNCLPVAAREPRPADASVEDGLDTILRWRGGRGVASHKVIISDVKADVLTNTAVVGTADVGNRGHVDRWFRRS
ncbi:MAG: hypothetical protein IIC50_00290 [Planctomycetes bacterium]|nr:hypothetical protein [Planctomycetota bacterium]